MIDTNVVLVLKDGKEIPVVYPERIGREYKTPWLDNPGSREWNIDVRESLNMATSRQLGKDLRFIVGEWGSAYGANAGVSYIIPFQNVVGTKSLSPEDQFKGDAAVAQAKAELQKKQKDASHVTFAEFSALEKRVAELEKKVGQAPCK